MAQTKSPYAEALLRVAKDHDCVDETRLALDGVTTIIYENKELWTVLNHPRVLPEMKKELLEKTVGEWMTPLLRNFLGVLVDNRRSESLKKINRAFSEMALHEMGWAEVKITTTIPLREEMRKRLIRILEQRIHRKIILKEEVDPAIKGGVILYYEGRVMDASILGRLNAYRYHLEKMSM